MEIVLDERAREILKDIVASYILSGEPVGSRTIAKLTREGLSPASVRNVMADLEEMGLLAQPHTSAGRIPTDKGYRHYVDSLPPAGRLAPRDRLVIDEDLARLGGEGSEAMELIPKLLSRLSSQVGYLIFPPITEAVLKHIEFVRLHARKILAILVDRSGVVSHRVLETEEDYVQDDLEKAGRYLVAEFSGLTLGEVRQRLVRLMAEEKAAFDRLLKNAVTLGTCYLDAEPSERRMVLEGTTNILKHPEFSDVETMRRLFQTFEERHSLVTLLDRLFDAPGVQVVIGSETDDPALGSLSLVASSYRLGDQANGWLGILGPTRMEYDRAVALVEYISSHLSSLLTRQDL
ncbi:MAG TPA: heat-inducible transcriptional repressor HrcA [Candidatus Polarisedimenticolia bacterium]|nr:heat-inducible transcriptional repressor HrcA [Candidatus Polarisedimenticolia bacterium]